jgi:hypothetical protein
LGAQHVVQPGAPAAGRAHPVVDEVAEQVPAVVGELPNVRVAPVPRGRLGVGQGARGRRGRAVQRRVEVGGEPLRRPQARAQQGAGGHEVREPLGEPVLARLVARRVAA